MYKTIIAILCLTGCQLSQPTAINSEPSSAQVFVNSIPVGKSPVIVRFDDMVSDDYIHILCKLDGYKPQEKIAVKEEYVTRSVNFGSAMAINPVTGQTAFGLRSGTSTNAESHWPYEISFKMEKE